mmetsp:Transcript_18390/g.52712  ORF Transcript_18390/g.52712 Transcript_18390/m.52712 type:complete len:222 (+) Transcript_18390:761-1426(+)
MVSCCTLMGTARWVHLLEASDRVKALRVRGRSWWMSATVSDSGSPAMRKMAAWSMSWKSAYRMCWVSFIPVRHSSGTRSWSASTRPDRRWPAPGPDVATQHPSAPRSLACAAAACEALASHRQYTHSTEGWATMASMRGTTAPPWPPKTCVTPADARAWTRNSAPVKVRLLELSVIMRSAVFPFMVNVRYDVTTLVRFVVMFRVGISCVRLCSSSRSEQKD